MGEMDTARLQLVWDMCRYERAWDPKKNSPWCPLFTQEDFDIYNFRLDLVFYYLLGICLSYHSAAKSAPDGRYAGVDTVQQIFLHSQLRPLRHSGALSGSSWSLQ